MQISGPTQQPVEEELDVLQRLLPLDGACVLELGCGAADKTRQLAEKSGVAKIVAAEVDEHAHAKNLQITDLDKVEFVAFGAEEIDAPDDTFDIVLMFKSLHHVPLELLDQSFAEIWRVLKPNGLLYISEPVFAGDFNEVVRLFHDESIVRQAAFDATKRSVKRPEWTLKEEYFFKNVVRLEAFAQFERGIMQATFMDHQLEPDLHAQVKAKFESYAGPNGYIFEVPNRVDLLQKVA